MTGQHPPEPLPPLPFDVFPLDLGILPKPGTKDGRPPLLVVAPTYRWFTDWCRKEGLARRDAVYIHRPDGLRGLGAGREVVIVNSERCDWDVIREAYALERAARITIRRETA